MIMYVLMLERSSFMGTGRGKGPDDERAGSTSALSEVIQCSCVMWLQTLSQT